MNIYDIAREAGVSIATVSRVLNHKDTVRADTRAKVEKVLKRCNYAPSAIAQGMVSKSLHTVAVLTVDIRDSHYARTAYTIEREFGRRGYEVILCNTGGDRAETLRTLQAVAQKQVDGLILVGSIFNTICQGAEMENLLRKMPVVLANGTLALPDAYSVMVDDCRGVEMAVEHLVKTGRRNLYYIKDKSTDSAAAKAKGFLSGMAAAGLDADGHVLETGETLEDGIRVVQQLLAECISRMGSMERWDGHRGFGPLNAQRAMERACALAKENGVGIVALGNNNHWMRGGTYGWLAAEKGCIGICWSNTAPNMPAWGAKDCRIGNNPLILAVPRSDGQHVMVDCALSQFSYGKLESTRLAGRQLPVPGGCDEDGQLTTDPAAIEKSGRALPIGYWKGSGLSILLDLIATLLSGGNAVHTIGTFGDEIGLTQIMIAIDPTKFGTVEENDAVISAILADIKASTPARPDGEVRWPGEGMLRTIKENRELGVPVVEEIWESVLKM